MKNEQVFVDTSAFYALMDRSDKHHEEAAFLWTYLLEKELLLLTSNYVVLETVALLQNRLGFEAARLWQNDVLAVTEIEWIDKFLHYQAVELWLGMALRRLSLTDCVSFVSMRHYEIDNAFCFDKHFSEHGFEMLSL